jgi:hypothetical protein
MQVMRQCLRVDLVIIFAWDVGWRKGEEQGKKVYKSDALLTLNTSDQSVTRPQSVNVV